MLSARRVGTTQASMQTPSMTIPYTPEEARRVAGILLPDILPYDPSKPASYPANGRTLTDDAIDVFLSILTNGKVTRDNVGPHTDLLASFPYVGGPHKARSA